MNLKTEKLFLRLFFISLIIATMKMRSFLLLAIVSLFFIACGNDKDVEAKFLKEIKRGIQQLKKAKSAGDITIAEDILDNAYEIEGVNDLDETGEVEKALDEFDDELEKAQERVLDSLQTELFKDPDLEPDTIKIE